RHLGEFRGPRLVVTHDPVEALALADHVLVLQAGRLVQSGTASEVAARPRSAYVAELLGVNLFRGTADGDVVVVGGGGRLVVAGAGRGEVLAVVHPRAVSLHRTRPSGSPRRTWTGRVGAVAPEL